MKAAGPAHACNAGIEGSLPASRASCCENKSPWAKIASVLVYFGSLVLHRETEYIILVRTKTQQLGTAVSKSAAALL